VLPDVKLSEVGNRHEATNFKLQAACFLEQIRGGACNRTQFFPLPSLRRSSIPAYLDSGPLITGH
jgi:hypothetical protein